LERDAINVNIVGKPSHILVQLETMKGLTLERNLNVSIVGKHLPIFILLVSMKRHTVERPYECMQ
jgi:hypothetical protein